MSTHPTLVGIVALLASLGCAACDERAAMPLAPSGAAGLAGTEWVLVELDGRPAGVGSQALAPTLLLAPADPRASGFAGCNRFTATYTLSGDRLRFGPVAMTRMFCNDGMDLERRYAAALDATRAYRLAGSRLELLGDQGVIARFASRA